MSTKKKGILTSDSEWRKHLRKFGKRFFWKAERKAGKQEIKKDLYFFLLLLFFMLFQ